MRTGDEMATLAALLADPARARMLNALMSGMALTATELALEAGVAPSTASSHLARLTEANLLAIERQGRHRYFRLFDEEIAALLEGLMGVATRPAPSRRPLPADAALRAARVCYDHLAGERGVWMLDQLRRRGIVSAREPLTIAAPAFFTSFGIDVDALARSRRPLCRPCLDWTERRPHLAGSLGAALLGRLFALRWARRELDSRAIAFTPAGAEAFSRQFGG